MGLRRRFPSDPRPQLVHHLGRGRVAAKHIAAPNARHKSFTCRSTTGIRTLVHVEDTAF